MDDTQVYFGDEVKALDDSGRVGGYAVRHKDEAHKDFVGDFFDSDTYLGARNGDGCDTLFHHGQPLKKGLESFADHLFAPMKTKRDDVGLFAETVLNLADDYEKKVYELIKAGKISFSSGAPGHMVKRESNGHLKRWPVAEISFTPTPCDFENKVWNLKALDEINYVALDDSEPPPAAKPPAKAVDGNALFNESLRQREMRCWELTDALNTGARKVVEGAAAQNVTGVEVDLREAFTALAGAFGPLWVDAAVAQAEEWLKGDKSEPFYLKSILDELKAGPDGTLAARTFSDHLETVLAAASEMTERARNIQGMRVKAGRVISAANRARIQAVIEQLGPLVSELQKLMEESEPPTKSLTTAALRTQSLRLQTLVVTSGVAPCR